MDRYPCTSCGACCRQLPPASPMNSGNGVCTHLDVETSLCAIYETRPLICRVDEFYRQRLADSMPRRVYYLVQAHACVQLDPGNAPLPQRVAAECGDEGTLDPKHIEQAVAQIASAAASLR